MTGHDATSPPVRVLVVDDEGDFADALAARLRRRGFDASAVLSGAEAVAAAASSAPDVVVLDLKMPGMDGLETLRILRRRAPDVAVIFLTGHGSVAAGIEGMRVGAEDFLQKPADIETLCTAIIAAARSRRGGKRPDADEGGQE